LPSHTKLPSIAQSPWFLQTPLAGAQRDETLRVSLAKARKMITESDVQLQAKGVATILLNRMERSEKGPATTETNSVKIDKQCVSILLRLVTNKDDPGRRILKESELDFFTGFSPDNEVVHFFSFWNLFPGARGLLSERIRKLAQNQDESRRKSAAVALVRGILDVAQTENMLDKLSNDPSWEVRSEVAKVAIQLGRQGVLGADRVSGFLAKSLFQDKDKRVRENAAEAMASEFDSECCSKLALRPELVHSLVTVASQKDAPSEVLLAACAEAALAAKNSGDDAFAIIQLMMRHELVDAERAIAPESVSLLAYISQKQMSKIADNFNGSPSRCLYKDYLRSLRHCAAKRTPGKDAVVCIVRIIQAGSRADAVGTVLGRHNPEVLGRIIREASSQKLSEGGSYSLGIVLANIPSSVAQKQKDLLSRLVKSENVWVRTGAAIGILSAGIRIANAKKVLNGVVNDAQVNERFRLMALKSLIANRQLKTVPGTTVEQLMAAQEGLSYIGYCKETILCELMNAIANGANFDDQAARAILSGLRRPDVSTCYRVQKAMLRVVPKLAARLDQNELMIAVKMIRDTVQSDEVRQLANTVLKHL